MIDESLLVELAAAVLTLVGVIYTAHKQNDRFIGELNKHSELSDARLDAKLEKHMAVTDQKLAQLTKEVGKHNALVERTYNLEARAARQEEQINSLLKKS